MSTRAKQLKLELVSTSPENGLPGSPPNVESPQQGDGQPSTPGTPTSEAGADSPTSGHAAKCDSPSYVTISAEGATGSSRSYASLTTINSTSVVPSVEEGVEGNTTYVTYVEGSSDQALFTTTADVTVNGENMTYPVYTMGESGTIYGSSGSSQYYTTANPAVTYAQEGGVTYLVASTTNNDSNDSTNANLDNSGQANVNHATRVSPATDTLEIEPKRPEPDDRFIWLEEEDDEANYLNQAWEDGTIGFIENSIEDLVVMICVKSLVEHGVTAFPSNDLLATLKSCPITVQWLLDNYETAEGVSLPRSTMYYHYMKHCNDHKLEPVNAASFGKLIRSVFLGLRTRRLGTRGNSKYHYYGIRLKPCSPLNGLDEKVIDEMMSGRHPHRHTSSNWPHQQNSTGPSSSAISPPHGYTHAHMGSKKPKLAKSGEHSELMNGVSSSDPPNIQHYLGDSSHVINSLPELDMNSPIPEGLVPHDLANFHSLYRELCTQLLGDMMNFQFSDFERRWRIFFRTETSPSPLHEQQHYESILPKSKLHALCTLRHVQDYVRRTDFQLYQNLVNVLLPDVLRPIPSTMTQTIRNFAKVVEGCMASALTGYPEEMIAVKLNVIGAFGQTLRRHTSLNHLAQAARAVLQNELQVNQMLNDLNRVDFGNVEEQASWVCGCNSDIVPDLEADFKGALAQHQSLEEWASWLESVVERVLRPHENTSRYTVVARYFLLKWSFYSSLVIRDLTLRSAASFGSFHLLRLLYDEYMFYLIENRVAKAINTLPIAVMGKKLTNPLHLDSVNNDEDSESCENMSAQKETSALSP